MEVFILAVTVSDDVRDNLFTMSEFDTPITLNRFVTYGCWLLVLFLQGTFSILPFINSHDEFEEILCYRIKYSYAVICIILSVAVCAFSIDTFKRFFLACACFLVLKVYSHYCVYVRIKYHDDGHDFVSRAEFLCLHVTYSVFHSWVTYCCFYTAFLAVAVLNDYQSQPDKHKRLFMGAHIENWAVAAMVFMSIEMTIYVAYYKDVVFAGMNVLLSIGVYFSRYKSTYGDDGRVGYTNGALFFVGVTFLGVTLLHSFQSAFYLKYANYVKRLKELQGSSRASAKEGQYALHLQRPFLINEFKLESACEEDFFKDSERAVDSMSNSSRNMRASYFD